MPSWLKAARCSESKQDNKLRALRQSGVVSHQLAGFTGQEMAGTGECTPSKKMTPKVASVRACGTRPMASSKSMSASLFISGEAARTTAGRCGINAMLGGAKAEAPVTKRAKAMAAHARNDSPTSGLRCRCRMQNQWKQQGRARTRRDAERERVGIRGALAAPSGHAGLQGCRPSSPPVQPLSATPNE